MRHLLTIASATSMVLCVATVVLWVRSYRISDHLSLIADHGCDLGSFRGRLRFLVGRPNDPWNDRVIPPGWIVPHEKAGWQYMRIPCAVEGWEAFEAETFWTVSYNFLQSRHDLFGLSIVTSDGEGFDGSGTWPQTPPFLWIGPFWQVIAPNWALVLFTAVLPAIWLSRTWRLRRRRKCGFCSICGYDLTANVSGTCPECGKAVEVKLF